MYQKLKFVIFPINMNKNKHCVIRILRINKFVWVSDLDKIVIFE